MFEINSIGIRSEYNTRLLNEQKFREVITRFGKAKARLCVRGLEAENITTRSDWRNGNFANLLIPAPVFQPRKSPFDVAATISRTRYLATFLPAFSRSFLSYSEFHVSYCRQYSKSSAMNFYHR